MDYSVIGILFLTFLIVLFINKRDIVGPAVLFSLSFVVSGLVFSINSLIWNYELSQKTITVFVTGIFSLAIGAFLVNSSSRQVNNKTPYFKIEISKRERTLMIFFCALYIVLRVLDVYTTNGSFNVFGGGLGDFRDLSRETSLYGKIVKIVDPICYSASIICMVSNALNKKSAVKKKAIYAPIILYLVGYVLSSSRIGVIYVFLSVIVVNYIAESLYKEGNTIAFKKYLTIFVYLILIVALFFGLGFLTGKSQNQANMADNLSLYAASSFAAFDDYLLSFKYNRSQFGTETFVSITNFLDWFGIESSIKAEKYSEYVALGDMSHATNVYTCFKPYLHDFNYIGTYIVLFLEGAVLQSWYGKAKNRIRKGGIFWTVFYAYLTPYILLSAIAERFFYCILTTTTVFFAISLYWWTRGIIISDLSNE